MADAQLPPRMDYPTSSQFTGEALRYMVRLVQALNAIPSFSYTSYNGGPNSNLTANAGALCLNVASDSTARLYVKQLGSGNTGWFSFATIA